LAAEWRGSMKTSIKLVVIISILLILSACNKDDNEANKLELYILRHVEGTDDFVKDEKPTFTGKDILSYEWSTHTIIFKEEFLSSRKVDDIDSDGFLEGGSKILGVYYPNQFAFYLDGEELYKGVMKPQVYISFMPTGPIISDSEEGIEIRNLDNSNDLRENEKLYEFLKENNLLS
jgi:hypothetical protein